MGVRNSDFGEGAEMSGLKKNQVAGWVMLAALSLAPVAQAESLNSKVVWYSGLTESQGTYVYGQVATPGGLWREDQFPDGKVRAAQVTINDLPADLQKEVREARLEFKIQEATLKTEADQAKAPGPRGQAPYLGHIRTFSQTAEGTLKMSGLPGVGGTIEDGGKFDGKVEIELRAILHTDPSDVGIFTERNQGETVWGVAAQTRNFADLLAHSEDAAKDDFALLNARMLRGGQEIVTYYEQKTKSPVEGATARRYYGALRLVRVKEAPSPEQKKNSNGG